MDSPIIYPIEVGKELILKDEKDGWVNVLDEKTGLVGWIQKELISENKPKIINSGKKIMLNLLKFLKEKFWK